MSTTFWNAWQLWEKLCFILGCGIVLVICGGCVKLAYTRYRLHEYAHLAAERAQIRKQLQRTISVNRGSGKDIPFGIRALESGIEVDGVWISGSNTPAGSTPVHSTPGSPTLAAVTEVPNGVSQGHIASDRASLPSQIIASNIKLVEIPPPVHGHDADRLSLSLPASGRPTYQPHRSSGLRFSDSNELHPRNAGDRDAALAALEGRMVGFGPAEEVHEAHRRSKSWATTSWNESYDPTSESSQAASNRTLLHPAHHPSIRLGGFPSYSTNPESEDREETTVVQDVRGTSAVSVPRGIRAPMSYEDLPDENTYQNSLYDGSESSLSDVSAPFDTLTNAHTSSSEQRFDIQSVGFSSQFATVHAQATVNADPISPNTPSEKTLVRYPHEMIEQPRRSQVIRKINSGFEILRPGTLGAPRHSNEIVMGDTMTTVEQDKKREPRKLHRRRGEANLARR